MQLSGYSNEIIYVASIKGALTTHQLFYLALEHSSEQTNPCLHGASLLVGEPQRL